MTLRHEHYELDEVLLIVDGEAAPAQIHGLIADLEWDDHLERWFVDRLYAGETRIDDVAGLQGLVESAAAYIARPAIQHDIAASRGITAPRRDPYRGCRMLELDGAD